MLRRRALPTETARSSSNLWQQIVRHPDSPLFLESLWRPDSEQTFAHHGPLAATAERQNVERAWGGIKYLISHARAEARPEGSEGELG
jgi:hypothetical protein